MIISTYGMFYYDIEEQHYIGYFGKHVSNVRSWSSIPYREILYKVSDVNN